jgi:hypothetical protein
MFNEYIPNGFSSWTEYNRAKERRENIKYWAEGIFGLVVITLAFVADGLINLSMGV